MTDEQVLMAVKMARVLSSNTNDSDGYWEVGSNYFIRTVTHHLTGRLRAVTNHELWIEDAAWIADDGRFASAIENGSFNEVEPYPSGRLVAVGRGSLIDATKITFNLPRSPK